MNVGVGGNFPGAPNEQTVFPAEMVVDYVRVYDKVGGYGPTKARGPGTMPWQLALKTKAAKKSADKAAKKSAKKTAKPAAKKATVQAPQNARRAAKKT
jgi:hypothetical protein